MTTTQTQESCPEFEVTQNSKSTPMFDYLESKMWLPTPPNTTFEHRLTPQHPFVHSFQDNCLRSWWGEVGWGGWLAVWSRVLSDGTSILFLWAWFCVSCKHACICFSMCVCIALFFWTESHFLFVVATNTYFWKYRRTTIAKNLFRESFWIHLKITFGNHARSLDLVTF